MTIGPDGRPRPVPICHALVADAIVTPIDEKPKRSTDPMSLARVRDVARDSRVALLVDHWDEAWSRLAWLRIEGTARIVRPGAVGHAAGLAALRARYPQYASMRLELRPLIVVAPTRAVHWAASPDEAR